MNASGRNHVVRKRVSDQVAGVARIRPRRGRIEYGRAPGQVALALGERRNGLRRRETLSAPQALVGDEEEAPVLHDRTAQRTAEIIELELRFSCAAVEEVAGVQVVVAYEL